LGVAQASAAAREEPVPPIAPAALVLVEAEPIASAAGIFLAAAREIGMPSEAVLGDSTGLARAETAVAASTAWDPAAEEGASAEAAAVVAAVVSEVAVVPVVVAVVVVAAEVGAGKRRGS
jgi:hypothetical protein